MKPIIKNPKEMIGFAILPYQVPTLNESYSF
jgi:hypothetical protein